jgi:hypothetical protein
MVEMGSISNFKKGIKMLNWDFPKLTPKDQRGKTIAMNNFRGETKNFAEIFIRELMQNFLDARVMGGQGSESRITIRLLNNSTGLDASYNQKVIENLMPHLKASYVEVKKHPNDLDFSRPEVLVIEEYLTVGLTGKTNKSGAKGKDERWANFWFGEGKASKKGGELGRAGEGKITYNMASLANSLISISTRDGEKYGHLFGKCVFPSTYEVDGIEYGRNCYWCLNDSSDLEQPIPTTDSEIVEKFKNAYCLERNLDQPGTSWVIPFPQKSLSKKSLIKALLKDFFFTIYSSKVEIEICGEKITQSNLIRLAEKYLTGEEPSIGFLVFLEHVHAAEPKGLYRAKMGWWKDSALNGESFENNQYDEIKENFDLGKHVGIKFPVEVCPKDKEPVCSFITVWIQKRDQASCEHVYVRGDLIISDEKTLQKRSAVFAAVIAEDEKISDFLANAEVASHLRWNREEDTLKENYDERYKTLGNVRSALPQLFNLLRGSQEKRVEDLLVDILSIPDSSGKKKKSKKDAGKGKKKQGGEEAPPPKPKFIHIDDGQGIRIKPGPAAKGNGVSYPVTGYIKIAYERQAGFGSPFSNYHPFDFDLSEFEEEQFRSKNMNILSRNENLIEFEITNEEFYLEITGFSSKQRVRAKVGVKAE